MVVETVQFHSEQLLGFWRLKPVKMAAIRATTKMIVRDIFRPSLSLASLPMFRSMLPSFGINLRLVSRAMMISYSPAVRCAAGEGGRKKASSRLSQVQQILHEAQERALSAGNEPIPKITIGTSVKFMALLFYILLSN